MYQVLSDLNYINLDIERLNMAKLYRETTNKRLKRLDLYNENTGEVGSMTIATYEDINRRYPMNGHKQAYFGTLEQIVDLSKTAQKLFFALVRNVDEWNRVIGKWKDLTSEPANYVSKAKKELEEAEFIAKIGKVWVLNPYIALPKYQKNYPNSQYEVQRIWTLYIEDADAYYEGIHEDAKELYQV